MSGKVNCCCPARVQHSVLCPRFRGEDGSEDLPVRFGAADARWCGVGGQVDAAVGAEAAGEGFSADKTVSATRGPTPGSLALMSGSRPSSGDANESLVAAASAMRSSVLLFGRPKRRSLSLLQEWAAASHLEFCRPAGPPMWGGGVVRTCGSGPGVPFVMAPCVPVSVHCGCRGLNIQVFWV
jgi:hypothetical protein